jgi:hypothetical protein
MTIKLTEVVTEQSFVAAYSETVEEWLDKVPTFLESSNG